MNRKVILLSSIIALTVLSACQFGGDKPRLSIQTPSISPDNTEVLFNDCRFGNICRLAIHDLASGATRLVETPQGYSAVHGTYSPDGNRIACVLRKVDDDRGVVSIVDKSGSVIKKFEKTIGYNRYPRFSPDGERIIYWKIEPQDIGRVYFVRHYAHEVNVFAGYERQYLYRPLYAPTAASYLPDRGGIIVSGTLLPGDEFFEKKYGENRIFVLNHDEPDFEPAFSYKFGMYDPHISANGKRTIFLSSDLAYGPVKVSILENDHFSDLPIEETFIRDLSISWDGTKVAFVVAEDARHYSKIWIFDLASAELIKLDL